MKFKILLSAYACEPNKGSEPAVGWNWALEISKMGHEVWVITRLNNKKTIDAYPSIPHNLHFIYYDLPSKILKFKKYFGTRIYYFLWQINISNLAKKLHNTYNFDLVHHITFVTLRFPSFLYKIEAPFIFGPVAGGEEPTLKLINSLPLRYKVYEYIRLLSNRSLKINPFSNSALESSKVIFCATEDTKNVLSEKFKYKSFVNSAIGISNTPRHCPTLKSIKNVDVFHLLYVGQIIPLKGIHILLKSIAFLKNEGINVHLTIIGRGNYQIHLQKLSQLLNIDNQIEWVKWLPQEELHEYYKKGHLLVFPSFHDSGGFVILEAFSNGMPALCLDIGGPNQIVNSSCGIKISTKNTSIEQIIIGFADSIKLLKNDELLLTSLSQGAINRAHEFSWSKIVNSAYDVIDSKLKNNEHSYFA
ncbi:glycosyltransferase family 4 protein [Telluribacter sp.]|jgi:glycosyltransferase involved in cell wall biosynthesis|uniref:glycosyltransferase family 4 protein n=1 Tax=Telluribacter sp. TaxID=1978767 RepID=UPI002E129ACD|nr:glycosyltransferase family 4 protein [Telluribacter sp.]